MLARWTVGLERLAIGHLGSILLALRRARMLKLAIVATIEVAQGRRDEFLPLLVAHRARCLKDEPGTLQFEALVPRDDETKVLLYEVYQDDAAFDVHFNGPSITRLRKEAAGMIVKIQGTRCNLSE
jgi:(4S)-4-hydroxy-5-phosphonooxypentane-2,3-dione isomerase